MFIIINGEINFILDNIFIINFIFIITIDVDFNVI